MPKPTTPVSGEEEAVDLSKNKIAIELECATCLRHPVKKPDGTEKLILTCKFEFKVCGCFTIFKGCGQQFCNRHGHFPCIDVPVPGAAPLPAQVLPDIPIEKQEESLKRFRKKNCCLGGVAAREFYACDACETKFALAWWRVQCRVMTVSLILLMVVVFLVVLLMFAEI